MEVRRGRASCGGDKVGKLAPTIFCVLLLCLQVSVYAGMFSFSHETDHSSTDVRKPSSRSRKTDSYIEKEARETSSAIEVSKRYLGGPGSYPPRCTSKCGHCSPCRAVHVPVPPGTPVTTEYYPEAWRCKCGNRLYMP